MKKDYFLIKKIAKKFGGSIKISYLCKVANR